MIRDGFIGKVVAGRFQIESLLSRGFLGATYVAMDIRYGKRCVIKMFSKFDSPITEIYYDHVRCISENIGDFVDVNVVLPYDVIDIDLNVIAAFDFIDGAVDLYSVIKSVKRINIDVSCQIIGKVIRLVLWLHRKGIVHGDIKPSNILLNKYSGDVWLADIGMIKQVDGMLYVASTTRYMHHKIRNAIGEFVQYNFDSDNLICTKVGFAKSCSNEDRYFGADYYSIGILLYEMLFGIGGVPRLVSGEAFANGIVGEKANCESMYNIIRSLLCCSLDGDSVVRIVDQMSAYEGGHEIAELISKADLHSMYSNFESCEGAGDLVDNIELSPVAVSGLTADLDSDNVLVYSTIPDCREGIWRKFEEDMADIRKLHRLNYFMAVVSFSAIIVSVLSSIASMIFFGKNAAIAFGGVGGAAVFSTLIWRPHEMVSNSRYMLQQTHLIYIELINKIGHEVIPGRKAELIRDASERISKLRSEVCSKYYGKRPRKR